MVRNQRDEPASAHISDPAACAAMTATGITVTATEETGGGIWGCNTEAEMDAIETAVDALVVDAAALKTAIDANNAAIDSILVALEKRGITLEA